MSNGLQEIKSLEDLFKEAESFGTLRIYGSDRSDPGKNYCAIIEFKTIAGTALEAKSPFNCTIREALVICIQNAKTIKAQFK